MPQLLIAGGVAPEWMRPWFQGIEVAAYLHYMHDFSMEDAAMIGTGFGTYNWAMYNCGKGKYTAFTK